MRRSLFLCWIFYQSKWKIESYQYRFEGQYIGILKDSNLFVSVVNVLNDLHFSIYIEITDINRMINIVYWQRKIDNDFEIVTEIIWR